MLRERPICMPSSTSGNRSRDVGQLSPHTNFPRDTYVLRRAEQLSHILSSPAQGKLLTARITKATDKAAPSGKPVLTPPYS